MSRLPMRRVFFTATNGLGGGWAQVALLKGEPRFSIGGRMLRFDEASRTFIPDSEFFRTVPEAAHNLLGRPAYDARGRLWLTAGEQVHVLALNGGAAARAAGKERAAEDRARQFDAAVADGNWQLAKGHGDILQVVHPTSAAAARVKPKLDEIKAKAEEAAG